MYNSSQAQEHVTVSTGVVYEEETLHMMCCCCGKYLGYLNKRVEALPGADVIFTLAWSCNKCGEDVAAMANEKPENMGNA